MVQACPESGTSITVAQGIATAWTEVGTKTLSKVNVGISDCTLVNSQQVVVNCAPGTSEAGQQSLASPKLTELRPLNVQVIRESFGANAANNSSAARGRTTILLFRMSENFHMRLQGSQCSRGSVRKSFAHWKPSRRKWEAYTRSMQ